ncbi:hypothetical protein EYB25_009229 [Talaromyces marneffei]|uniref:Uncharacterized protein n=2 Tax=Talaromyces marneffei TaxID=37727 RepID=B6QVU3_TALMQ|nr:uncharacterized protein EYB26_009905 [Talaromyces marneffei]EEA19156.1 hypothetical protein PMAA_014170 [Talaromyces marneffei ATCC 18224]KAE8548847.1 hypothetical protein EYB25_009229 [Talaromyces marneffei]QGA22190.1 hypothetical protein EYB26_009905 [Talaromyces marneffei]
MTYKTNYELWNPALTSRRPSQMSDIDIILAQTYPHVAMLPYMQCQHCNYEESEEEQQEHHPQQHQPSSPSSFTTTFSSPSIRSEDNADSLSTTTSSQYRWLCLNNQKRLKLRHRLRQLWKRASI